MTRHRLLIALATAASLAMPGIALADDDDDVRRPLRGIAAPQIHWSIWGWDDGRRWFYGRPARHDHDDDDRRGRWDDDDDDDDDDD
ncbi:hypothetical protein [Paracoccus sp. S3-43]|uniref:hypothetical protein n=1 Tax=Paracoccus sp. S3-43 TaxID=3030011 RepID=UPI0023B1FEF1|nr:hypothetical protein [Paracoccus sp. S3-43]WEF25697.1 hypothetical protein PXD02_07235 [Paracoccus sp. S3-43]